MPSRSCPLSISAPTLVAIRSHPKAEEIITVPSLCNALSARWPHHAAYNPSISTTIAVVSMPLSEPKTTFCSDQYDPFGLLAGSAAALQTRVVRHDIHFGISEVVKQLLIHP